MPTRAHTPVKAVTFFFLFRTEGEGVRQPGTSGITFCPLLLGALGRSSAAGQTLGTRLDAGRAGAQPDLCGGGVRKKKRLFSSLSCPGLSAQAR